MAIVWCGGTSAKAQFITQFSAFGSPQFITAGPDGNLWFTKSSSPTRIGYITPQGRLQEFQAPSGLVFVLGITTGPDGNLWFALNSDGIGRMTPGGDFSSFPTPRRQPQFITAGPDGNLWFTERFPGNIGRITPGGTITEYAIPTLDSQPMSITAGPDGNLWFTESAASNIGQITPSGIVTEFPLSTSEAGSFGITAGPDGNLWFTMVSSNPDDRFSIRALGRVTPQGEVTEFPTAFAPQFITAGPDGNLWFTAELPASIGRITPQGEIVIFPLREDAGPQDITTGPDGNLWFTESRSGKIGRLDPALIPTATPTITHTRTFTATPTITHTRTFTPTPTITRTFTVTPTRTATPTFPPNVRQLTNVGIVNNPRISDDGGVIVYDDGRNVFVVARDASFRRQLTDTSSGGCVRPWPNASGSRVAMECTANVTGSNPDLNQEIVLLRGVELVAITRSPDRDDAFNRAPQISADGQTVVFESNFDYAEQNVDGRSEVFLWRDGALRQVSRRTVDTVLYGISADGDRVLHGDPLDGDDISAALNLDDDGTNRAVVGGDVPTSYPQLLRNGRALFASCEGRNPTCLDLPISQIRIHFFTYDPPQDFRQLTQVPIGFFGDGDSVAANRDGSRIAAQMAPPDLGSGDDVPTLFEAGRTPRLVPGVPSDARAMTFDADGRYLAFLSRQNITGQNAGRQWQLFVAEIPLASDPPTPTPTPTPPARLVDFIGPSGGDCDGCICVSRPVEESGIVQIGQELIAYRFGGSQAQLCGITRGYGGTAAVGHEPLEAVIYIGPLPSPGASPTPTATRSPTPVLTCVGDCGHDGAVTVDEIIRGVNIALGTATVGSCDAFDVNDDDAVTVDEIVKAVNAALNGCSD